MQSEGVIDLVPRWFIPLYELIIDVWGKLGDGGFGSVCRAKWLDSEVVVTRVILDDSDTNFDTSTFDSSSSFLSLSADPSVSEAAVNSTKRAEALEMFRREVDIWFGFSHPHVIQLFGACHVGRPFFVCEYATNGTLVKYLQAHPDKLWTMLHEAALGVQYLHARGVVHGDLKGNNIVIGSDFKAKVTDFGQSSIESSEAQPLVSAA
ncbi:Protein kinase-like domain [Phytophthora cactorum]|nr:Protein kinase-like domain [Phytophthora cactorum]